MHVEAYAWIAAALQGLQELPATVVEFGAKNINGTVRTLLPEAEYVGVDIVPGPCVDIVADAADYLPPSAPDLVVCAETLEHAARADEIVRRAVQIVRPGGYVVLTCAGPARQPHSAVDGGPVRAGEYYRGVPIADIAQWVVEAGGEVVQTEDHPRRGDVYVLARRTA